MRRVNAGGIGGITAQVELVDVFVVDVRLLERQRGTADLSVGDLLSGLLRSLDHIGLLDALSELLEGLADVTVRKLLSGVADRLAEIAVRSGIRALLEEVADVAEE